MRLKKTFKTETPPDVVERIVAATFAEILDVVANGDDLKINRFGRFYPQHRKAKTVKTPLTKQTEHKKAARYGLAFRSSEAADKLVDETHRQRDEATKKKKPSPRHAGLDHLDTLFNSEPDVD